VRDEVTFWKAESGDSVQFSTFVDLALIDRLVGAGCWLVDIHAFDDTRFRLLPPKTASGALFKGLVETSLIGGCPEGAGTPAWGTER
jgi:hypothetical protein